MSCRVNFLSIPECVETFKIPTGLIPEVGTDYTLVVTDRFNHKYSVDAELDEDGIITVTVDDFPLGLFTRYSGPSMFEITDGCQSVGLTMCDIEYGYYAVSFYKENTPTETFEVCCS